MSAVNFLYLAALLVSLFGQVLLDYRFRLTFWRDPHKAAWSIGLGVLFFLAWDVAGIGLGIFFRGSTNLMTGVLLAPELPLEEPFFLALLCYLTLNLFGWRHRKEPQRR